MGAELATRVATGDSLRVRMQSVTRGKVWRVFLNERLVGVVHRLPSGLYGGGSRCQGLTRSTGSSSTRQHAALATALAYLMLEQDLHARGDLVNGGASA